VVILFIVGIVIGIASSAPSPTSNAVGTTKSIPASPPTLRSWMEAHDGIFQTLANDTQAVQTATQSTLVEEGNFSQVQMACKQLQADVTTFERLPPIPQAEDQGDWGGVLGSANAGAQACIMGTQNPSSDYIDLAQDDFATADSNLKLLASNLGVPGY
jgi:hypothetical protein